MPGKPLPTAVKKARGTLRKCRANPLEPEYAPDNSPEPPAYMSALAREEWARVYPEMVEKLVLKRVDRRSLEAYCEAYAEYRFAAMNLAKSKTQIFRTPNGAVQQVPYVSMKRNWMLVMLRYASELGITPSSRSRISADDTSDKGNEQLLKNLLSNDAPKD